MSAHLHSRRGRLTNCARRALLTAPLIGAAALSAPAAGAADCTATSAKLSLAPVDQAPIVRHVAGLTATLTDSCAQPVPGGQVVVYVQNGPDEGTTLKAVTGPDGVARLQYSGARSGTDGLFAGVLTSRGPVYSNPAYVHWTPIVFYSVRAFGASARLTLAPVRPVADTFAVTTKSPSATTVRLAGYRRAGFTITGLSASRRTFAGGAVSTATVGSFRLALPGLPVVTGRGLTVTSRASCSAGTVGLTIRSLRIGAQTVDVRRIRPTTVIQIGPRAYLILAQPLRVSGADQGRRVLGLRLRVFGRAEVILGSATAVARYC